MCIKNIYQVLEKFIFRKKYKIYLIFNYLTFNLVVFGSTKKYLCKFYLCFWGAPVKTYRLKKKYA